MIDMNKKYKTESGLPVRILCVDRKHHEYPVIGLGLSGECEYITYWDSNGRNYINSSESDLDLIEVSPYEDFKVDDLCVVSGYGLINNFRYFAKEIDGTPFCFDDGRTSFTASPRDVSTAWAKCRKATPEEIATKTIKG